LVAIFRSAGFLAGYVEDFESVEAIMKKFERVDEIMKVGFGFLV
jgi:hypothetical protein